MDFMTAMKISGSALKGRKDPDQHRLDEPGQRQYHPDHRGWTLPRQVGSLRRHPAAGQFPADLRHGERQAPSGGGGEVVEDKTPFKEIL